MCNGDLSVRLMGKLCILPFQNIVWNFAHVTSVMVLLLITDERSQIEIQKACPFSVNDSCGNSFQNIFDTEFLL